ncbi:copper-translocating P-type ATPase [Pseudonocardia sp. TMWB2A]|uniref:copper-translocating P-type ATPase n=1 Tax=Pseudonocardia sp. TMWB2A TaxID=687430 RepID=UPI00307F7DE2
MMNIMLLSVSVWSGAEGGTRDLFHWLSAIIAIPTVIYSGRPFFKSAWAALKHGRSNMDVPISIGVVLATALSLFETVTHGQHAYFDGAVMLLFFLLTGRVLDSMMRGRARSGVAALLKQSAGGALVRASDGTTRWRSAEELAPNMRMIVAAGERLAADGIIEAGETRIDLSLLTGESAPQKAKLGDKVLAGTLNLAAPVTVKVTAAGPDTTLADIARLMEDAGQSRSTYVQIADRAARLYAPVVHILAFSSFVGWMLMGAGLHYALLIAVAVLIITCPCALGLAVPASQVVAAGTLMRNGILVKDGSALERLAEADRVLLDKTGTLTLGRPRPANLDAVPQSQWPVLLALASASRHPLSNGLRKALEEQGVAVAALDEVTETGGIGVAARWDGVPVVLGRPGDATTGHGLMTSFSVGDSAPVTLRFTDSLRPDTQETLDALRKLHMPPSVLSGDRAESVAALSGPLGLDAQAEASPQDKLAAITTLSGEGYKVLMVGDGLNDGPALAAAHVSLAPATASDVGQQAADAVFMGDSLKPVATSVRVARRTMRIIKQNFTLAICYNIIAVPLAIFGYVTPLVAAIAMSGSSLLVVGNALRLRSAAR